MTDQNHNFEIETALLHFQSALDGAVINRYAGEWADPDKGLTDRNIQQRIKVNYVFGPKQRILADLEGKTDTVKFPIVAICPTGMGRDDQRVKNKNDFLRVQLADGNYGNYQVIPWNINVSVTIMARFQEDMSQIISNFSVMSNPYFIFSWKEPKTGRDVRAEVYWDGQMAMEYPGASSDLPPNAPFRVMGSANFIIKTFLYRTEIENSAKICSINTDIIVPNKFYCNYDLLTDPENVNGIDSYVTLGKPQLRYVDNYYFKSGDAPTVLIQGDGFALTEAIYVSGSNPNMYDMKEYDVDGFKFSGKLVTDFELLDAQNIQINLPPPSSFGFVDIIITNECGYGLLTEGVNRCSRVENPYKVTDPKYAEWRVLQFPYLNGLIVSSDLNTPVSVTLNDTIIVYNPGINESETLTSCSPVITVKNISDATSESVFSTVNSFSSFWNDAYFNLISYSALYLGDVSIDLGDLNTLSANWNSVYTNVQDNSAQWSVDTNDGDVDVNSFVYTNSADLIDVETQVQLYSADWLEAFTNLITFSADYLFTDLTSIQSFTSNWNSSYTDVSLNSAFWSNAYTNLVANSALYLVDDAVDITELQTASSRWNSTYTTLNTNSSIWDIITTIVQSNSSLWSIDTNDGDLDVNSFVYTNSAELLDTVNVVQDYSALWILSGTDVEVDPLFTSWAQTYSADYENLVTFVANNSSDWIYQGSDIKSLTSNWQNAFVNLITFSSDYLEMTDISDIVSASSLWNSSYTSVNINSASWINAYNNLVANSALYLIDNDTIVDISELQAASSFWNSVYTTVNSGSADWNYQGFDIKTLTADWQEAFVNLFTFSADYLEMTDISDIISTSAFWNSTYSTVNTNSAVWNIPDNSAVNSFVWSQSADIIDTINTVQDYSALWILSGGSGGGGPESDPLFTTWGESFSALYDSVYTTVNDTSSFWNKREQISLTLDGEGSDIQSGTQTYLRIPYNCTVIEWKIVANSAGNLEIDVWRTPYISFPPTVGDTITGSEKITLSGQQTNQDLSLTTWDVALSADDYLLFNVDSASAISHANISIIIQP